MKRFTLRKFKTFPSFIKRSQTSESYGITNQGKVRTINSFKKITFIKNSKIFLPQFMQCSLDLITTGKVRYITDLIQLKHSLTCFKL